MILLVGATGRLGRAVASLLIEAKLPFRAACRDPSKAQWLVEQGVEVVPVDLSSATCIAALMEGVTQVVSCIHGLLGRSRHSVRQVDVEGHRRLIDGAWAQGVSRFVYMSAFGAAPDHPSDFWRAKALTEQYLRSSGIEYVILRPTAFMDLYAHDLIGAAVLRGNTVFLLGKGRKPRNMIAVADVASIVVKALSSKDLAGQTIELGGWENLTEREVASLYAGLGGQKAKVRSVPVGILKLLAAAITPFHAGAGRLLRLSVLLEGREDLQFDASSMKRLGIDPVRLHEFALRKAREGEAGPASVRP